MRIRRGRVALYGISRRRPSGPRWPARWDRTLDASWTPVARMRDALESAQAVAARAVRPARALTPSERCHRKEHLRHAASEEGEHLTWAIVWLLRWMFDRADERSIQKEGRKNQGKAEQVRRVA